MESRTYVTIFMVKIWQRRKNGDIATKQIDRLYVFLCKRKWNKENFNKLICVKYKNIFKHKIRNNL